MTKITALMEKWTNLPVRYRTNKHQRDELDCFGPLCPTVLAAHLKGHLISYRDKRF